MQTFGGRLRQARDGRKLSQEQLGELVGVTKATISKWENNRSEPTLQQLGKLREIFDTSLDELIPWEMYPGGTGPVAPTRAAEAPAPYYEYDERGNVAARARSAAEAEVLVRLRSISPARRAAILELLRPEGEQRQQGE